MRKTLAFAMLVTAGASTVGAQNVREYRQRVAALEAEARSTALAVAEYQKLVDERARLHDTVRAGPLLVVSAEQITPLVRTAAAAAIATLQSQVGGAASRLAGHVFFARLQGEVSANEALWIITGEFDERGERRSESWHENNAADLARSFASLGLREIGAGMSPAFRQWSGEAVPTDSMTALSWSTLRVAMVSSPTTVARRCYDGDLAACRVALGLSEVADPVLDWYDAKDRRRLIQRFARDEATVPPIFTDCLAGNDQACVSALRRKSVPSPFFDVNRPSLIRQAIAIGGPGAIERLIMARGERPEDYLAKAAGVSADSVLAAWQHNVHDARVASDNMSPRMALMSVTWILALGLLSLRSPRWR